MNGYDDLDTYNGYAEHDMWADYDYHANTGELDDRFDDSPAPFAPEPINPWQSNTQPNYNPRKRLERNLRRISSLQSKIEDDEKLILDIDWNKLRSESKPKLIRRYRAQKEHAIYRIETSSKKLAKLQEKIPTLKAAIIYKDNKAITIISVVLTCAIVLYFSMLLNTIIEV